MHLDCRNSSETRGRIRTSRLALERLLEYGLGERFTKRIVTIRRCRFTGFVTDVEDIDRYDLIGQVELLPYDIRFEHTDPKRIEAQRCGTQHHVVGHDRGIDVADLLSVILPGPHFVRIDQTMMASGAAKSRVQRANFSIPSFDWTTTSRCGCRLAPVGATRPASRICFNFSGSTFRSWY